MTSPITNASPNPTPTHLDPASFTAKRYKRLSGSYMLKDQSDKKRYSVPAHPLTTITALGQAAIGPMFPPPAQQENSIDYQQLSQILAKKGYEKLAQWTKEKKQPLWKKVLGIGRFELLESLAALLDLLERLELDSHPNSLPLLEYLIGACKKTGPKEYSELREMLGKLLFLVQEHPPETLNRIPLDTFESLSDWVRVHFDAAILTVQHRLQNHIDAHDQTQLQDPRVCSRRQLAVEISKLLITDNGMVNSGLIAPLIELFVKDPRHPINHEINILLTLRLLDENPAVRSQLGHMEAPTAHTNADLIVRVTLDYPRTVTLSSNDSRKAALAALLSHLRQSPSGTCFATCLAIELQSSQLKQCLNDFQAILRCNKLSRTVILTRIEFPFILSGQSKSLQQEFWVDGFGKIKSEEVAHFWEAPGIAAACRMMGIPLLQPAIEEILTDYFRERKSHDRFKPVTIDEFLRMAADYAFHKKYIPSETAESLFRIGSFAYDSQTTNPLLTAWMNAIAGMSEGVSSSMIKSQIIRSIAGALDSSESGQSTVSRIKLTVYSHIANQLTKRIRLEYDPSIQGSHKKVDVNSTDGAFILFDKGSILTPRNWQRIDSPQSFQEFVLSLLDTARMSISIAALSEENTCKLDSYLEQMRTFIRSNEFIIKVLQIYDPVHAGHLTQVDQAVSLPHTPWITKSGNDAIKTLHVYLQKQETDKVEQFQPIHAEDLLTKIIDKVKAIGLVHEKVYYENPNKLLPMRMPGIHAFSLMPGHLRLSEARLSPLSSQEWIKAHVIEPGKKIAASEAGPQLMQLALSFCLQEFVSKENKDKFSKSFKHLSEKVSLSGLRARLMEMIQLYGVNDGRTLIEKGNKTDLFLYQNLPPSSRYQLEKSAVHFADTNWASSINDIHFCFVFNPGSGQLELWEALDNGTLHRALNQKSWFSSQTWEFYLNPEEILPGNNELEVSLPH